MKPMRTQHGRNLYRWSMFKTLKLVGRFLYRSNTFIVLTIYYPAKYQALRMNGLDTYKKTCPILRYQTCPKNRIK